MKYADYIVIPRSLMEDAKHYDIINAILAVSKPLEPFIEDAFHSGWIASGSEYPLTQVSIDKHLNKEV